MKKVKETQSIVPHSWGMVLASLLPLWLLSISTLVEGFPRPPISIEFAIASFMSAVILSIVLLWKRWLAIELFLYNLIPLIFLFTFDEISTTYKSPFIILCALILTVGVVGYRHDRFTRLHWLILPSAAVVTLLMASHATRNYGDMVSNLGYVECFPGAVGCPPLTGQEPPWWIIFFSM